MVVRKYEIKHYSGLESELIPTLPSGDTFFCTDTNNLYKYNEDKLPHLIGDGPQGPQGPAGNDGVDGADGIGIGNTGAPFLLATLKDGSSTYSDSNNTIYASWTGAAGTYHFTLPSAATNAYRVIRIINDGSVTASHKIHVVAPGVETIDGLNEYVLNKSYSGVQAWSDGSNWIVIQAKSH